MRRRSRLLGFVRAVVGLVRERFSHASRERVPEPMVMDDHDSVAAFHAADPVLQLPIYQYNAEAMSRLLPEGGVVLDLGSGSARLLAHLAAARPDVRIIGTDLSDNMLATGRELLRAERLDGRVELRRADITALPADLPERVDLVSTVWALHHLPSPEHLARCLGEMARVRQRYGCAVWIFDFVRLRRAETLEALIALSPEAPERLREDGIASVRAAWTEDELRSAIAAAGLDGVVGRRDRFIGNMQAFHARARAAAPSGHARHWVRRPLPRETEGSARMLQVSLPPVH
jgi:tRNA (cmo5U34)-methyltransferase